MFLTPGDSDEMVVKYTPEIPGDYLIKITSSEDIDSEALATATFEASATDEVVVDGVKYRITSDNLFVNGSFDDGVAGWKATNYTTDAVASNFTLATEGGFDGGAYITTTAGGAGSATAIRQAMDLEAGKKYYFAVYTRKGSKF